MGRRKRSKFKPLKGKYQPAPPKQEYMPDWGLISNQALVLVLNFLDGTPLERARTSMTDFLKRHKRFREKIRESLIGSFSYIEGTPKIERPKEAIENAKKEINTLAREIWS